MSNLERDSLYANRYRVLRQLGKTGGFGEVFLVQDNDFPRMPPEALKRLRLDTAQSATLGRYIDGEIETMRELSRTHDGIPTINNYGRGSEGEPYFTMEFVDGVTLAEIITKEAPVPPQRVLRLLAQILDVLDFVHRKGYIHRDLKPGNVMVTSPGTEGERVRIIDFGIASIKKEAGTVAGTPGYMDLEQVSREDVSPSMDLFALGVIAAEMLTGIEPPKVPERLLIDPKAAADELARRVQTFVARFRTHSDLDPGVRDFVLSLLELNREDRPTTSAAVRRVGELLGVPVPTQMSTARLPSRPQPGLRYPVLLTAITLVVVAGLVVVVPHRCEWLGLCPEPVSLRVQVVDQLGRPVSDIAVLDAADDQLRGTTNAAGSVSFVADPNTASLRLVDRRSRPCYRARDSYPLPRGSADSVVTLQVKSECPDSPPMVGSDTEDTGPAPGKDETAVVPSRVAKDDGKTEAPQQPVVQAFQKTYRIATNPPSPQVFLDGETTSCTDAFGRGSRLLNAGRHTFRVSTEVGDVVLEYQVREGDANNTLVLDVQTRQVTSRP